MIKEAFPILALSIFSSILGVGMITPLLPIYAENMGATGISIGMIFAGFAISRTIIMPVSGRLSDRIGRKWISVGMLLVGSGAITMIGIASSSAVLLGALAVYGLVSSLAWNPVLVAWAGDLVQTRQGLGTAIGLLNAFAVGSSFVGPVITGLISDLTNSLSNGFYIGAASLFVAAVLCMFVKEGPRRSEEPSVGTGASRPSHVDGEGSRTA